MKNGLFFVIVISIYLFGCSQRIVDFTMVSTKNFDFSKTPTLIKQDKRVVGKDMYWIIILPFNQPNMKTAIDKAIESVPGCVALMDGVVTSRFWWIPYITGQVGYIVEGTPLIDPTFQNSQSNASDYRMIQINKDLTIKSEKEISKEEYLSNKSKKLSDGFAIKLDETVTK